MRIFSHSGPLNHGKGYMGNWKINFFVVFKNQWLRESFLCRCGSSKGERWIGQPLETSFSDFCIHSLIRLKDIVSVTLGKSFGQCKGLFYFIYLLIIHLFILNSVSHKKLAHFYTCFSHQCICHRFFFFHVLVPILGSVIMKKQTNPLSDKVNSVGPCLSWLSR